MQEEKERKDADFDVIHLTVSFGELSSLENTPTKMNVEQDHHSQDGTAEHTDKKKRKRRKQKKIGEDLWSDADREEVESLPVGIDGLNVYIVNRKDGKDVKECLQDGRKWKKDCPTNWRGRERVRYANCRGSYKCNNSKCPF